MRSSTQLSVVVLFLALAGCPPPATTPGPATGPQAQSPTRPQTTVLATAHMSHADHLLGRPFDENFQPLSGPEGRSVFDQQPKTLTVPRNEWQHRALVFNSTQWLKAHLSAWDLLQANGGYDTSKRYATRRVYYVTDYVELDDTQKMRDLPQNAKYYLWRIYRGHLYENYLVGSQENFNATVSLSFLKWGASVQGFAGQYKLEVQEVSRGLKPNNREEAFAIVGSDMQRRFVMSSTPQPILVEFRSVPTTSAPADSPIKFSEEPPWEDGNYILSIRSALVDFRRPDGAARTDVPGVVVLVSLDGCRTYFKSTPKNRQMMATWSGVNVNVRLRADDRLCVNIMDYGWVLSHGSLGTCTTSTFDRMKLSGNKIVLENCGGVKRVELGLYKDK